MKKWLCGVFCVCLLLVGLSNNAYAMDSGFCGGESDGSNLTWSFDDSGTLFISGTGAMENYSMSWAPHWYDNRNNIRTVIIDYGVTSISDYAFMQCTNLTSVSIPNSVTSVGKLAFDACTSLKQIYIPESVASIGERAFWLCTSLESINMGWNNSGANAYDSRSGVLFNAEMTKLIAYPSGKTSESYKIPNGVTTIATGAFYNTQHLKDLTFPSSMTAIPDHAFFECPIETITVPATVTHIGDYAFFADICTVTDVYFEGTSDQWSRILGQYTGLEDSTIHYSYVKPVKEVIVGETQDAEVVKANNLSLINITYNYVSSLEEYDQYYEDSDDFAGYIQYQMNVTAPSDVRYVAQSGWSFSIWSSSQIEACSEYMRSQWNGYDWIPVNNIPPFDVDSNFSIFSNFLGESLYVLFFGLDAQKQPIGYAVVKMEAPAGEEKESMVLYSGTCGAEGDNLTWVLDSAGTLTISGTGAMATFDYLNGWAPWRDYGEQIINVIIEEGITSISDYAFSLPNTGRKTLSSVRLPESLQTIGIGAFSSAYNLREIVIPKNVSKLEQAFSSEQLIIQISEDNPYYTVKDGAILSKDGKRFIQAPSARYFHAVDSPDDYGLENEYTIPEGIVEIGEGAFQGCRWFSKIILPESVKIIRRGALTGKPDSIPGENRQVEIVIPDGLDLVEGGAFDLNSYGADNKRGYEFYSNVTKENGAFYIGNESNPHMVFLQYDEDSFSCTIDPNTMLFAENAFGYTWNLRDVYSSWDYSKWWDFVDQWGQQEGFSYGLAFHNIIGGVKTSVFGLGYCGAEADGKNISWVHDTAGVLTITGVGEMASYSGDYSLVAPWNFGIKYDASYNPVSDVRTFRVDISNGITTIGDYAFRYFGTAYLTNGGYEITDYEINLPNSLTKIGKGAFFGSAISRITIPAGVTSIGESAFSGSMISGITIYDGITTLEQETFAHCSNLKLLNLPNTLTIIGQEAFSNCDELTSLSFLPASVTIIGEGAFSDCSGFTTLNIPASVVEIGERAFMGCANMSSVTLPNSVTMLGDDVFMSCDSLTHAVIGTNITTATSPFLYADNLKSVTFTVSGSGKRAIGDSILSGCRALTNVTIPAGVIAIGEVSFAGCTSLKSITIPTSVSSIGERAFASCNSIISLVIPDGVKSIGDYAFSRCDSLEAVTIPNSMVDLGSNTFLNCNSLTSVTMGLDAGRNENGWSRHYFYYDLPFDGSPVKTLTLVNGSMESYSSEKPFEYSSYITGYQVDHFFGGRNSGIETIIVSEGVKVIGNFQDCINLRELYIPKSVSVVYSKCLDDATADNVDIYYSGTRLQWQRLLRGEYLEKPSLSDSVYKANVHYGEEYKPIEARVSYSAASGTSVPKVGMKTVQFDAGADLYKNGKTRTTMNITWNWNLFGSSAIGYSKDLATAAIILSGNAYTKDLVKDTLENKLGFSNTKQENYEIGAQNADLEQWISNTVGYSIASTTQIIDGKRANVIAIVLRGTPGTPFVSREWKSNLREMENGFLLAANDVISGLNSYIADPKNGVDTSLPVKYFITGHSRGAAVANLLGPVLSDAEGKQNVFVYTFACPTTSNDPNRQNYNNIKNFINVRDAVPALPGWLTGKVDGYNRFGLECSFDKSDAGAFDSWLSELTDGSTSSDVDNPIKEHCIAVYAAYVLSADLFHSTHRYKTKVISVKCPVDVAVYDSYDRLLGTITDNVPDDSLIANGVYVTVDGDEKYIYTTSGFDLRLELTGTDTGTMTYSVEEIDASSGETMSSRTFSDVNLTDGKTMTSAVVSDIAAVETQLFIETGGEITAEIAANGSETDVVMISFDTDLGEPLRDMAVAKGGKAGALPTAKMDGYAFVGWYTDPVLASAFDVDSAINSAITLYAKYEPLYDVYGYFTNIAYDGKSLTAKLDFEYDTAGAQVVVALYQDGQMVGIQSQSVALGASGSTVSMSLSGLYGIYQLKAFLLDAYGSLIPVSESTDISFYAN